MEKTLIRNKKSAGNAMHRNLMRIFRLYMLIGGMPQAIATYLDTNNLQAVDVAKRAIVDLYEEDFTKIDSSGLAGDIYDAIPANLSGNASRYVLAGAREGTRAEQVVDLIPDMLSSYTVNIAYHANNPGAGMSLEKDPGRYKLFTSDVGLFVTLAFKDKDYTENVIYNKLLSDKLEANMGYIFEDVNVERYFRCRLWCCLRMSHRFDGYVGLDMWVLTVSVNICRDAFNRLCEA